MIHKLSIAGTKDNLELFKCSECDLMFWKNVNENDFGEAMKIRHLSVECRGKK